MSQTPSIKGSVFSYHAESLMKLVSAGEISREELERRLEPGDLDILEGPIHATQWYDIGLYEQLLALRRDLEGDGRNDCLLRFGAESAERLLASGVYQQLDYLGRTQVSSKTDAKARFEAFGRDLRLLLSLSGSLLNFTRVEVKADPEREGCYTIEYSDAAAFPEVLCWTNQGFFNRLAAEHGQPDLWQWERPSPDRVLYRMTHPL